MKKIIFCIHFLLFCSFFLPGDYTQKYKDRIAEYDNPMFYKFEFYRYRDPIKRKGLIEKIETSFILCEDQGKREFNMKGFCEEFGTSAPGNAGCSDVGCIIINQYSRKGKPGDTEKQKNWAAFTFCSKAGWFYNEQNTLARHQIEKKDPFAKKYLTKDKTPFVEIIKRHLTVQDPITKSYLRLQTEAYTNPMRLYSPIHIETLLYLNQNSQDQRRNEASVELPSGIFYRTKNGEFLFTEDPELITKLLPSQKSPPEKTNFLYIQQ